MKVRRFDRGSLGSPVQLPNGWMRADAYLTRIGVFVYARPDGTTYREYRPAEEVFRADSLDSLRQVPLTLEHPTEGNGLLDAENAKKYTVGNVGHGYPDWESAAYVCGPVMITDAATVAEVKAGKQELSCAYTCDMEEVPGEYLGQSYDAVQRNIFYNHVAVVGKGRAGAEVKIKLDAADAVRVIPPELSQETTVKVKLDGIDFDISDPAAQALEKERAAREAKLDEHKAKRKEAEAEAAKASARADSAEAKVKELSDPKALQAKVSARASLEVEARKHLGADVKLDALDDFGVKVEVLKKLRPEAKLDGKGPDYVSAYYDSTMEGEARKNPALDKARALDAKPESRTDSAGPLDEDASRKKMQADNRALWKTS